MRNLDTAKSFDQLEAPVVASVRWASPRSIIPGLVFGGAFLFLAFRGSSFQGVVDTLQAPNPQFIVLGIGLYALYLLARTLRWRLLLAERTAVLPFAVLLRAVVWGSAANTIIPHSGEILRSFVARKPLRISATSILGTIASERLYDFAIIIAFTAVTLVLFQHSPPILQTALLAVCAMGFILLTGLALVGFEAPLIFRLIGFLMGLLPRRYVGAAQRQTHELSAGIRAAFSNPHLVAIGLLSVFQWLCVAGCIHLGMECLGLGLSPWLAFIVLPLTTAGLTLPTAPVYLGTMQVCFLAGLTPFGVSNEEAIAASLAYVFIVSSNSVFSLVWYFLYVLIRKRAL